MLGLLAICSKQQERQIDTKQLHTSSTESLFKGFEQQQQADGNPFIDIYECLRKYLILFFASFNKNQIGILGTEGSFKQQSE